jgi:hypothetical protein
MAPSPNTQPALSIVVGAHASERALSACLEALDRQRDGAEVIVCEAEPSSPELRERFGWARFLERPGGRVPHLWSEGIDHSRGRIVALTNSTMVPADDWTWVLKAEHERWDAVAGAIEPGEGLRVSDWAEYFCRYSPDMLPFEGRQTPDLPGDNASYKRDLLETARELYRDGFWEPDVHRALDARGAGLWHSPRLVVCQGPSAGARAFAGQRLHHGRAHGAQRGARYSAVRNLAGVLGAPLVPLLLTLRIVRRVWARGRLRGRLVAALPLIALFNAAWAAGEAAGHLDALRGR